MDAITLEQVKDIVFSYVHIVNYFIGFALMFIFFLFGCYVNNSFNNQDGIEESDFIGTIFVSLFWPLAALVFMFIALDKSFKFFAKIITSKWK